MLHAAWLSLACCFALKFVACLPSSDHLALSPKDLEQGNNVNNQGQSCKLGSGEESHEAVKGDESYWPYQKFKSSPYNPPEFDITTDGEPLGSGLIFLTPSDFSTQQAAKDVAPIIVTDKGQLVWNGPSANATNLHVSTFENKPVITYFSGVSTSGANVGHGYGNITFLDTSYNTLLVVCPKVGLVTELNTNYPCDADIHESHITPRNTLLFSAYNVTRADLTSKGGPSDGWVYDSLIFEIEPRTHKILFRWSSLEHVPVSTSHLPLGTSGRSQAAPYDYFHVNSAVTIGNTYLINGRHTFTTYLVDAPAGNILWRLNGIDGGSFGPLPAGADFSWQHHVRPHNVSDTGLTLTMFNNHNAAPDNGTHPTNGLAFRLPLPPGSGPVKLLQKLVDPAGGEVLYADSQGDQQVLANGNRLMGYGQLPVVREYGPGTGENADVRWQARFGVDSLVQNYRAFRQEWSALPARTKPSLVVEGQASSDGYGVASGSGCKRAYVSWNGATGVEKWRVYEGSEEGKLKSVGDVSYKGFETSFVIGGPIVQVAAVTADGVEHRSNIVKA
ncbi:MAG: hypothetical protein MMC23_000881 [Stictis urceolatum]|nr:hypothetical protein [Stictis urceolata]